MSGDVAVSSAQPSGRLVVLEGPDGVGKSTLSSTVAGLLGGVGKAEVITFPGREVGTLGRLVYDVHHSPQSFGLESITDLAKQALHIAAHLDAIERRILPLLRSGTHVVLDRYWWSTWVYGIVGGVKEVAIRGLVEVERLQWRSHLPVVAILLDRPSPIDRVEPPKYWNELREQYATLAASERAHYPVYTITNGSSLAAAERQIEGVLSELSMSVNLLNSAEMRAVKSK